MKKDHSRNVKIFRTKQPHTETHSLEWERLYERNRESQKFVNTGEEGLNIIEISTQFKKLEK